MRENLAGDALGVRVKRYGLATRPKFLIAAVLPVVLGTMLGSGSFFALNVLNFVLALGATVCVHAGANVLNDYFDALNGNDDANNERIFPYTGGSRFIQNGVLTRKAVAWLGIVLLLAGTAMGLALTARVGHQALGFGLIGVLLGVLYSAPPIWLSARGLGELTVGLAFGPLPVIGAAWVQSGLIEPNAVFLSVPVGIWAANILLINEVPDATADAAVGRGTLVVRLGHRVSAVLYLLLDILAVAVIAAAAAIGDLPLWGIIVPALLLVPAFQAFRAIRIGTKDTEGLKKGIETTLAIHTVGTLALLAAFLLR